MQKWGENIIIKVNQTQNQKEAFKNIKQITILNPSKRDGGLFRCYKDESENLIAGPQCISKCLEILSNISNSSPFMPKKLPTLPKLSTEEIKELSKQLSKNKAITEDGVSDTFLKTTKNIDIIADLWKNREARLIPLNKAYPQIPNQNQFRPIVVLSPLFKFLELRFSLKLKQYLLSQLQFPQAGFIQGRNTQQNIKQVLQKLKKTSKTDKMNAFFIDFSNAYNTIIRELIYSSLRKKNILNEEEIQFLEALNNISEIQQIRRRFIGLKMEFFKVHLYPHYYLTFIQMIFLLPYKINLIINQMFKLMQMI